MFKRSPGSPGRIYQDLLPGYVGRQLHFSVVVVFCFGMWHVLFLVWNAFELRKL